ncbi:MAG TPA: hypothetical protein VG407_11975 [Caulobacteraceae bacterium]|jgi:hypothetical protein|nr:hypothetical protein [Caulobacteraceae bacterium]
MAKGQKKSNREVRKPKQDKPKPQASAKSFVEVPGRGAAGAGKKPGK